MYHEAKSVRRMGMYEAELVRSMEMYHEAKSVRSMGMYHEAKSDTHKSM